jgi:uncharacterized LabA/DUF88 family protein
MNRKQNNFAFIDSQNLYLSIKEQNWKLDYKRFRIFLKDKYKCEKVFLFVWYIKENENMYKYLKNNGYILIFKPILEINWKVKWNVDAELVLHTMIEYPNFNNAILVTWDWDFYCLAKYLQDQNKFLKILIPNRHKYSSLFKKIHDHLVYLNTPELRKKLEQKKRPST